jgi:hypothetical protein
MTGTDVMQPDVPRLERADRVAQFATIRGRNVAVVNADGTHHDYRAWSELVLIDGSAYVDVCRERHWWIWATAGVEPRLIRWPASAVWVVEWAGR